MSAYMIAMVKVHDPEIYRQYAALTPPTIKAHGGKFVTRGGVVDTLEGEPFKERLVILEFPSKEAAHGWYNSPEYQAAKKYREAAAEGRFLVIDGVADGQVPDLKVVKTT